MEITPRELRDVEIRESIRGYHRDDVNDLLERAAATIEAANERVQQMGERLSSVQNEVGRTRETEDILHRTLLLAQRAADEAVAEATGKARQMLDDAEIQSRRLVADSEAEARRRGEAERRRLEEEIVDLAARRDALLADVEALTRFEAEYRERMVRALEADLYALRSRPTTAPGTRPDPTEVEIPSPGTTMRAEPAPAAERDAGPSTREVDVRSLFEQAVAGTSAEPVPPAAAPEAAVAEPAPPLDLMRGEAIDAEVLDDDAFFATLRDAVHDDAPLGPRDEDEPTGDQRFFDQDADRGGFRDVFRRRR